MFQMAMCEGLLGVVDDSKLALNHFARTIFLSGWLKYHLSPKEMHHARRSLFVLIVKHNMGSDKKFITRINLSTLIVWTPNCWEVSILEKVYGHQRQQVFTPKLHRPKGERKQLKATPVILNEQDIFVFLEYFPPIPGYKISLIYKRKAPRT